MRPAMLLVVLGARAAHADCSVFPGTTSDSHSTGLVEDKHAYLPMVSVGGGYSRDGWEGTGALGLGWGTRHPGTCPGFTMTRVLASVRVAEDRTAAALTYGWYSNDLFSAGLDLGVEADVHGAGPTARLTLGKAGITLRLGGAVHVGGDGFRLDGDIALMLELTDLVTSSN